MTQVKPSLFGLSNSNRDFELATTWGKNQFNTSFPASLCCYLASKGYEANYLSISDGIFATQTISIEEVFRLPPNSEEIFFAFESLHTPFQKFVIGALPRTDLVIQRTSDGKCMSGLEIKLTALPDNTTCDLNDSDFGSEIVVRPDTIVYLACSLATCLGRSLNTLIPNLAITNWSEAGQVLPRINEIIQTIKNVSNVVEDTQQPFLLQPVWKTRGKSPDLSNNCLDVFVWSNAGFCSFIAAISNNNTNADSITRQTRTAIWLFKMLLEIKSNSKFNHELIIDDLSYNTKNDKAFASAGNVTNKFMKCTRLTKPIIKKEEIKSIILGGGQKLLSPERRFDAIIFNSPELFS